jgi:UDP-N-acetylmuramate dehydrogenase
VMNWPKSLKGKVRLEEPLSKHTTFKIGGPAKLFIEPFDLPDLRRALSLAEINKLPVFLLGSGSNILASDKGIKGMVLRLSSGYFKNISRQGNTIKVGSGFLLSQLVLYSKKHGLSGVEFLIGIPGTIGGALVMNAGAWGKSVGDIVQEVTVMDYQGKIKILAREQIKFAYRKSSLAKYIILNCKLKLAKDAKQAVGNNITRYIKKRRNSQDLSLPSAGCIFKNPVSKASAGKLIDLCFLKNKRIGGACVSHKHANFILNCDNARSEDILKLISLIKKKVKQKFNINLKPEIKIWQ